MRIDLTTALPDPEVDKLAGTRLNCRAFDQLVDDDTEVFKPDGSLLLVYRRNVIPKPLCKAAHQALRRAARTSQNRGQAAGRILVTDQFTADTRPIGLRVGVVRTRPLKRDGTLSNTSYAKKEVESGIIGAFERTSRHPYCRLTAFNLEEPKRFNRALPFIRAVDQVFAREVPERYAAQRAIVEQTHPDFLIHGTAFTTVTVNRNWQTAVHKDAGDYRPGFGVMAALRAGHFKGCYLVFPKYRVAVDMQTGGLLMADVHEWHGNTPIVGKPGEFERVSCVFYYRQKMNRCGSNEEELQRAKNQRAAHPSWE